MRLIWLLVAIGALVYVGNLMLLGYVVWEMVNRG